MVMMTTTTTTTMTSRTLLGIVLMTSLALFAPRAAGGAILCPERCACLRNATVVDCSGAGLAAIPTIPNAAEALILDDNPLMTLSADAFRSAPNVRQLSLRNCQLRSVAQLAFNGLGRLVSLVLAENSLSELPAGSLTGSGDLESLVLADNEFTLTSLAPIVSGLRQLRVLDIGSNDVNGEALPAPFSELVRLRSLRLSDVAMSELPAGYFRSLANSSVAELTISGRLANVSWRALADLTSLETLDVSNTDMTSQDAANLLRGLENATSLSVLKMDAVFDGRAAPPANGTIHGQFFRSLVATSIRAIHFRSNPRAFGGGLLRHRLFRSLHDLAELYLDGCGLHAVHGDVLHGLARLRVLGLRANFLTCHDRSVCAFLGGHGHGHGHGPLANLETLDLSYNNLISSAALTFDGRWLPKLRTLLLSHNRLTRLGPDTFRALAQLRLLDLARNPIAVLEPETFAGLPELTALYVNGTDVLAELPAGAFRGCARLRVLDLSDGDIGRVHWRALAGLGRLRYLNLRNNYLGGHDSVMNLSLDRSPDLWKLDLGYNRLTSLPPFVRRLAKLEELFLDNNYLPDGSLRQLADNGALSVLDLSYNAIRIGIDEEFLDRHPRLAEVTLEGNPFACDCHFRPIGRLLRDANVTVVNGSNHRCSYPEAVAGRAIFRFRPSPWRCRLRDVIVPILSAAVTLLACAGVLLARRIGCDGARIRIRIKDFCNWDNCYFRLSSGVEVTDLNDQDSRL